MKVKAYIMFAYMPGKNIKRWKWYESSTNEDVWRPICFLHRKIV